MRRPFVFCNLSHMDMGRGHCGRVAGCVAGGAGCSHAVQPWAMLRCGGGPGVAPGAKTRGPLVRRTWRRSFVSRNPFECFAVIESVTRFECFTVTEFFTVIECFTVTGTHRDPVTGEIVGSERLGAYLIALMLRWTVLCALACSAAALSSCGMTAAQKAAVLLRQRSKLAEAEHPVACPPQWLPVLLATAPTHDPKEPTVTLAAGSEGSRRGGGRKLGRSGVKASVSAKDEAGGEGSPHPFLHNSSRAVAAAIIMPIHPAKYAQLLDFVESMLRCGQHRHFLLLLVLSTASDAAALAAIFRADRLARQTSSGSVAMARSSPPLHTRYRSFSHETKLRRRSGLSRPTGGWSTRSVRRCRMCASP